MNGFTFGFDGFVAEDEGLREALTSTGNGYFCTRGAAEWEDASDVHYAGTYAHGVYNRATTILGVHPVANEDLVTLPNWLVLKLRIDGDPPLRLADVEVLDYRHDLDLRSALVCRRLRFRDAAGREFTLASRRFVSMTRMHKAALAWTLTAHNWSGRVEVVSALDGRVLNRGVARYRQLEGRHLDPVAVRTIGSAVIGLEVRTRQGNTEIAEAARAHVYRDGSEVPVERRTYQLQDYVQQVLAFELEREEPVSVEKVVALYTSRDRAITEPLVNAGKSVLRYRRFDDALDDHRRTWDELWQRADVTLPADDRVQQLLRLHISHVLQVCSPLTPHHDAGVPARGLNGEAYRGHVFWDELFVFPFLNYRFPEISRGLLMYRYRRLGEARSAAIEAGYRGAMYPWQSGSDGQEETQEIHLNPISGRWEPDASRRQRHVNAAIFYNVWHYFKATEDHEFLRDYGAEMMLEIARFWFSIAHFNADRERWEIHGVMGPDEFHERLPGSGEDGLRNNAYTNVMAAWVFQTALQVLELLPHGRRTALTRKLGLDDEEIERWREAGSRMYVPFHEDGVISQFEGYEQLRELDWDAYRAAYSNIQRLDRIMRAEGEDPNAYKVSKQADAVMLFHLFSEDELSALFRSLGYPYGPETARATIDYYDRRTSHGSTLSLVTFAGALARHDPASSWERFRAALESDVGDLQGGTTKEGIHMGVMSGTLDLVQRAYAGTRIRDGVLCFAPTLADRLDGLAFSMQFAGTHLRVRLDGGDLTVAAEREGFSRPIEVRVGDDQRRLVAGDHVTFALHDPAEVAR